MAYNGNVRRLWNEEQHTYQCWFSSIVNYVNYYLNSWLGGVGMSKALKLLALFILALMFIMLLPYIVFAIITIVALLLKYAWLPVVIVGIVWIFTLFED